MLVVTIRNILAFHAYYHYYLYCCYKYYTFKMIEAIQFNNPYSGKFFPTARGLIGYFEVTWHLTMKLFPAKISERATLQKSMTSERNSALLPANVDRRPPLQRGLMNFQLYNKLLKDRFLGKQFILFPVNLNVSLSGLGTRHSVFISAIFSRTCFTKEPRIWAREGLWRSRQRERDQVYNKAQQSSSEFQVAVSTFKL